MIQILTAIFVISVVIQLVYYVYFYMKFALSKSDEPEPEQWPPVSVIIAARNEAENLERFLPSVLNQDYPDYTVIVVDHASEDDTALVLKRFEQQYQNLYVTRIPASPASSHTKKFALLVGMKAAKTDILLFTDADCKPVSDQWIKLMVRHFSDQTQIVLGYGGYIARKGLLDKWIRTDTAFIAMQYFGFALRGLPYMGVGRNIAWRKSFFMEKDAFREHFYEPSGSDDIFVNRFGRKDNTKCEFSAPSFTRSKQPQSWQQWIYMKRRHFGSWRFYRPLSKLLLAGESLSRQLFFFVFVVLILLKSFNIWTVFLFFVREVLANVIFLVSARKLGERKLGWFFVFYDLFQPFFNLYVYLTKKPTTKWI